MNLKLTEFWEKAAGTVLLAMAFILPLAFYLKTYDSSLIKEMSLAAGVVLALSFAALRGVELGRWEIPANRSRLFALGAALLAWIAFRYAGHPHPAPLALPKHRKR